MMLRSSRLALLTFALSALPLIGVRASLAQDTDVNPASTQQPPEPTPEMRNGEPLYRIQVVGRDVPTINYFNRSGRTSIGFQGTSLLPTASGSAEVDSGKGNTTIDARFQKLPPANTFGPEYLTYVLWAISPDGRPVNLGEVLPDGNKASIKVTTGLQAFGLIVTAEPYFAVVLPSDVVVLQNVVTGRTAGVISPINAHFTLLPRGAYAQTAGRGSVAQPITRNERSPLDLYQAINAVQIAQAAQADRYAPEILARAKQQLSDAQDMDRKKRDRKQEITYARSAVQTAEDARLVSLRKKQQEERAAEAADRKAREDAANQQAQQSQLQAQQSQLQAQQAQLEAQRAAAQQAQSQAEAARAQAAQQSAEQQARLSAQQTEQARAQAQQLREQLRQQLNEVLQTRETARGLVVNLSDVLFNTGRYNLKQDAQLKLARVSGILLAHPDLKVQVEGYTDNVGGQSYNQKLSEQRADTVQQFVVSQGVPAQDVTAVGYGLSDPVADNATAAGRAQNRRVEMVVSGPSIGIPNQSAPGQTTGAGAPAGQPEQYTPPPPSTPANPSGVSNPPQQQPQ
jgi:outer membrane protein OmpA-like peptidoglycan-associated protein